MTRGGSQWGLQRGGEEEEKAEAEVLLGKEGKGTPVTTAIITLRSVSKPQLVDFASSAFASNLRLICFTHRCPLYQ